MTTRQTPDAVRDAIREDIAKQLDEPWRDRVILRPEQWQIVLAALDSRAGEDVRPNSWAATPDEVRERAQLLADVELHLKSSRIFITTREKMHPCGVELHDELLGRVTAAIDSIGKAKGHD